MFRTLTRRGSILAVLTAAFTLIIGGLAHADNVENDVEVTPEVVTIAEGGSATVKYRVKNSSAGGGGFSGCDPADGSKLTLTINAPSGVTVSPASLEFTTCDDPSTSADDAAAAKAAVFGSSTPGSYLITVGATDSHGTYNLNPATFTLVVTEDEAPDADNDGVPDADDNCPNDANSDQANADGDALGDVCDSNSYAPAIDEQAGNADGFEGTPGNPETAGSFSDQDGNDTLTLSIGGSDAGTLVDNGDGSFSWSHTTTDDASGSVTVTATDGEHTDASQTFTWTAENVAPVVGEVTATATGACSVDVSAPFTDQGSADTHDASIDWGDGGADTVIGSATSTVTGSHTYTSNGTFTIGVTVNDDDGGTDSADTETGFATKATPSALLQPINAAGTRSIFKLGSTIPVKITVTGCDGLPITTLTPTVTITKLDSTPDGGTTESPATATATNGLTMRYSDGIYIYNLSTKLSQQYGTALSAGSYRITVSDSSFVAPTSALVELKK